MQGMSEIAGFPDFVFLILYVLLTKIHYGDC